MSKLLQTNFWLDFGQQVKHSDTHIDFLSCNSNNVLPNWCCLGDYSAILLNYWRLWRQDFNNYLFGVIVRMRVVFRKNVIGDWCLDYLSGIVIFRVKWRSIQVSVQLSQIKQDKYKLPTRYSRLMLVVVLIATRQ